MPGNCKITVFTFRAQCVCVLVLQIGLRVRMSLLKFLAEDFFLVYENAVGTGSDLSHTCFILR